MELIHADFAFANTLRARRRKREVLFDNLVLYFNKAVDKAAKQGKNACIIRWKDFDIKEDYATDEEAVGELLDSILSAGYEVELCYISSNAYNPCGIAVGWGNSVDEAITEAFNMHTDLYRGE